MKPLIHDRLPLHEAAAAHRLLESNANLGKVLLMPVPASESA